MKPREPIPHREGTCNPELKKEQRRNYKALQLVHFSSNTSPGQCLLKNLQHDYSSWAHTFVNLTTVGDLDEVPFSELQMPWKREITAKAHSNLHLCRPMMRLKLQLTVVKCLRLRNTEQHALLAEHGRPYFLGDVYINESFNLLRDLFSGSSVFSDNMIRPCAELVLALRKLEMQKQCGPPNSINAARAF